jgi:hypothetical protein
MNEHPGQQSSAIGEAGAFLTFRRGEQVLTVIILAEGDIIKVTLTVNRAGP